jgi:hypothetical protein
MEEENSIILTVNFVHSFFLWLGGGAFGCLLAGLYKPWIMLWWQDKQNRRKVITLYGSISLISYVIYLVLRIIIPI